MKLLPLLTEIKIQDYNNPNFVKDLESAIEGTGSSFICTYVASAIKMLEGNRVKVYGFSNERNPKAIYFKDDDSPDEGHHFAVLDNRYIIDPWMYNNYVDYKTKKTFNRSVFDLNNPKDSNIIEYVYGDPKTWVNITNSIEDFNKLFPKGVVNLMKYSSI